MGSSQGKRKAGLSALQIIAYSLGSASGILIATVIVLAALGALESPPEPVSPPEDRAWAAKVDELNRAHEQGIAASLPASPALVGLDQKRVTRAALLAVFGAEGFTFADATEQTDPPQQVGHKDTTVVALVGASSSLTQVSVMGIPDGDDDTTATIMLGMALALQQLAPWAADWWAEAGPRIMRVAQAAENKIAAERTDDGTTLVQFTTNVTLPMLMLTVERLP